MVSLPSCVYVNWLSLVVEVPLEPSLETDKVKSEPSGSEIVSETVVLPPSSTVAAASVTIGASLTFVIVISTLAEALQFVVPSSQTL